MQIDLIPGRHCPELVDRQYLRKKDEFVSKINHNKAGISCVTRLKIQSSFFPREN